MAQKKTTGRTAYKTATSSFGVSSRVSHDSSAYYARAMQPPISEPQTLDERSVPPDVIDQVFCHTSEHMPELPDRSVHLMVTSPPYNVGKEYDEDLTFEDHMALLKRVMLETFRVLVPGGRACVNIANLGRKPYIPVHSYAITDALACGFYMRGELIWQKGRGAGASTAWGSWLSATDPIFRDTHEYILVFQKPPFGRRKVNGKDSTIQRDEFLEFTKSVWVFNPESAKRAKHPAPFPVELPYRLMQLLSFSGDVVLDPFMGTGATAIAARQSDRQFVGYDTSSEYCEIARERISSVQLRQPIPSPG